MTLIEYIGGLMLLKGAKIRLWDYSNCRGNIQGLICPLFSIFWALLGAGYYFLVHPHILSALFWLSENLAFSFVIGLFFGVFLVDMASSAHWVARVKAFADENGVIVKVENLKAHIHAAQERASKRVYFFFRLSKKYAGSIPIARPDGIAKKSDKTALLLKNRIQAPVFSRIGRTGASAYGGQNTCKIQ